jgi:hypothetical protein
VHEKQILNYFLSDGTQNYYEFLHKYDVLHLNDQKNMIIGLNYECDFLQEIFSLLFRDYYFNERNALLSGIFYALKYGFPRREGIENSVKKDLCETIQGVKRQTQKDFI